MGTSIQKEIKNSVNFELLFTENGEIKGHQSSASDKS